jgi:hypothetical protein
MGYIRASIHKSCMHWYAIMTLKNIHIGDSLKIRNSLRDYITYYYTFLGYYIRTLLDNLL